MKTKTIILSQGKLAIVDDDDFEWLNQWKWSYLPGGYAVRVIRDKMIYLHRVIMGNPIQKVDHINGNRLDNRKENLRIVDNFQHARNKSLSKSNTSGYKGVYFHKASNKFQAYIDPNKKRKCLGYYNDPKEAAQAYNQAATKYFGEYARLNQI